MSSYKGAEEQVKLAYSAVQTEIMAQTVKNGKYDATNPANTALLADIVAKDLSDTSKWSVDGNSAGVIKITYTDSKIDQGSIDGVFPKEEGKVQYLIKLSEQNAELSIDTKGKETLTEAELAALASNGLAELEESQITNSNLVNNTNIRGVVTGEVPIPSGFYYVTGSSSTGLVISDVPNDDDNNTKKRKSICLGTM